MSVIPQIYNQGTGLIGSTSDGNTLPDTVVDLIVENSLTVLGESNFNGLVTINADLVVNGTTTTDNLVINNILTVDEINVETVICQEIGSSNAETFSLPAVNGTVGQVLSILDDAVTPITTEWADGGVADNFVSYDTATNELNNNIAGVVTVIDDLEIPNQCTTGLLSITNLPGLIGSGERPLLTIGDAGNVVDKTQLSGLTAVTFADNTGILKIPKVIITDGSIGSSTAQSFELPTDTSTAINNQTLSILDDSVNPPTTYWKDEPDGLASFVTYDPITYRLQNTIEPNPAVDIQRLQLDSPNPDPFGVTCDFARVDNNTASSISLSFLGAFNQALDSVTSNRANFGIIINSAVGRPATFMLCDSGASTTQSGIECVNIGATTNATFIIQNGEFTRFPITPPTAIGQVMEITTISATPTASATPHILSWV